MSMAESIGEENVRGPEPRTISLDYPPVSPVTTAPLTPSTIRTPTSPDTRHSFMSKRDSLGIRTQPQNESTRLSTATFNKEDEATSGVILIGMDGNDAATAERSTSESRRSSSSVDHRPSETNDTDHDETENNKRPSSANRRSHSSSSTGRPSIPIMLINRRRSTSSSSISSTSSNSSLRQRISSDSVRRSKTHAPQTSSVDASHTSPTTVDSVTNSHRHSATEFQKFRDQLHNGPAAQPILEEWQLHPNPHAPKSKTEILRIERTYMPIALPTKINVSDVTNYDVLIPRFATTYPTLLREYGISETEWTAFIVRVNKCCMEAFDPFRLGNIAINIIAVLSCWLSEWFMPNLAKRVGSLTSMLMVETDGVGKIY
jgi:Golgin subfamily A member 7/ERF4 family